MSDEIKKPTVLIIVDGFGIAPDGEGNAVSRAKTPAFDKLTHNYPVMPLRASGEEVGLSWGEMGNSEVGHLAIGAGRVYYQMFPRINRDIASGEFLKNEALLHAAEHAKKNDSALHLVGMISGGGVHSADEHCHELLKFAKEQGLSKVFVHAITDGRDTTYNAGVDFISTLQSKIQELGVGKIASLSGRYYAMDRDNRWGRTEKAYKAIVNGEGQTAEGAVEALKASYKKEIYDEEFVPTVLTENGKTIATIQENDAVICFNFRSDRMRQLTKTLTLKEFEHFDRPEIKNLFVATMAEYEAGLPVEVVFPPQVIKQCLAHLLSEKGLKQLHIAETEKYAHVTFFLNGTHEDLFEGEERVIIPSPKVPSYNQAPEMSAREITDRVIKEMQENNFDFIVMNFANSDMVGHTGDFDATVKAVETVDECVGKIVEETLSREGKVFITADHGNAEELKNLRTGDINKEHSTNPVPFYMISKELEGQPSIAGEVPNGDLSLMSPVGMLADIAPTILTVMGIEVPPEMAGQPLL